MRAVWTQRALRILGSVTGVFLLGLGLSYGWSIANYPPDLALNRPFELSSRYDPFDPATGKAHGVQTKLLFHTNQDDTPWVTYDLGSMTDFNQLEVVNRSDCCFDRAAPMLVELSEDGKTWHIAARREQEFSTWTHRFPALQRARFVRLRVMKRSNLHLERVSIRRF